MINCKIVPRHWIISLWWFYAIKHYFPDKNNKGKKSVLFVLDFFCLKFGEF